MSSLLSHMMGEGVNDKPPTMVNVPRSVLAALEESKRQREQAKRPTKTIDDGKGDVDAATDDGEADQGVDELIGHLLSECDRQLEEVEVTTDGVLLKEDLKPESETIHEYKANVKDAMEEMKGLTIQTQAACDQLIEKVSQSIHKLICALEDRKTAMVNEIAEAFEVQLDRMTLHKAKLEEGLQTTEELQQRLDKVLEMDHANFLDNGVDVKNKLIIARYMMTALAKDHLDIRDTCIPLEFNRESYLSKKYKLKKVDLLKRNMAAKDGGKTKEEEESKKEDSEGTGKVDEVVGDTKEVLEMLLSCFERKGPKLTPFQDIMGRRTVASMLARSRHPDKPKDAVNQKQVPANQAKGAAPFSSYTVSHLGQNAQAGTRAQPIIITRGANQVGQHGVQGQHSVQNIQQRPNIQYVTSSHQLNQNVQFVQREPQAKSQASAYITLQSVPQYQQQQQQQHIQPAPVTTGQSQIVYMSLSNVNRPGQVRYHINAASSQASAAVRMPAAARPTDIPTMTKFRVNPSPAVPHRAPMSYTFHQHNPLKPPKPGTDPALLRAMANNRVIEQQLAAKPAESFAPQKRAADFEPERPLKKPRKKTKQFSLNLVKYRSNQNYRCRDRVKEIMQKANPETMRALDICFDECTAHQHLEVLNPKQIRYNEDHEVVPCACTPDREVPFQGGSVSIFGTHPLPEKRCFWEVIVPRQGFIVGVAFRHVPRSQLLGYNNTSWCVKYQAARGMSFVHNCHQNPVSLFNSSIRRIGILLNKESGTLEFLNVHDKTTLVKVHTRFNMPLYPVFALFGDGCLTINSGFPYPSPVVSRRKHVYQPVLPGPQLKKGETRAKKTLQPYKGAKAKDGEGDTSAAKTQNAVSDPGLAESPAQSASTTTTSQPKDSPSILSTAPATTATSVPKPSASGATSGGQTKDAAPSNTAPAERTLADPPQTAKTPTDGLQTDTTASTSA